MARTVTLTNLLAEIRWAADVEGATRRHTDRKLVRATDQAVQRFRLKVSDSGHSYYLDDHTGAFTVGDENISSGLPTDMVHLYTLDVQVGTEIRDMYPYEYAERNKYQAPFGNNRGVPTYFHFFNTTKIEVIPTPDAAYPWKMRYLPTGTDLTTGCTFNADDSLLTGGSQTFDGIAGWEDWVVYEVAQRVSARDAGTNDNYEILKDRAMQVEADLLNHARKRVRQGPVRRLDTRGMRMLTEARNRWKAFTS